MSPNFKIAIPHILRSEGGFAETPAGEVVNRGINIQTLLALGYKGTRDELREIIRNLDLPTTEDIYFKSYWTLNKPSVPDALDKLPQAVANKILDMAVLSGQITALRITQKVIGVKVDGFFGPTSLATALAMDENTIIAGLIQHWTDYLSSIADKNIVNARVAGKPDLSKYWAEVKVGWLARAAWNGK